MPAVGAFFYFGAGRGAGTAALLYAATKLFTVIWPFVAVAFIAGERLDILRPEPGRLLAALPAGLASGLILGGAIVALWLLSPLGDAAQAAAPQIRRKVAELGLLGLYIPFSVFLALLHSFIEEIYWRWFVYGWLSRLLPVTSAQVVAGVAFAAHHLVILGAYFPLWLALLAAGGIAAGGIFWCRLYQRQGSLAGVWLSHVLVDAAVLAIGYRLIFAT
jgi:membrane protease YdiL (CAAX protease family)